MSEISSILAKIDALKILVARDSITPPLLGSLLYEIVLAIPDVDAVADSLKANDRRIEDALNNEISLRRQAQDAINRRIDAIFGENASEAIDNFSEILKFLDGFKDSDRLADRLTAISLAIDTLRQVAYQDITISRLNGWLAKRPAAIRNEAAGHMFRILHNGTPVATAEWYSNYSEEHGECLSGVMRLRGYGICRCENNLPGVFAYEPLHHPEYSEWEIPDAGDHWGTPVDVTPRRCECTPAGTLTPGEIDGIWSGTAPGPSGAGTGALTPGEIDDIWTGNRPAPSESPAGAFTPEDIDKIWEQTIKKP